LSNFIILQTLIKGKVKSHHSLSPKDSAAAMFANQCSISCITCQCYGCFCLPPPGCLFTFSMNTLKTGIMIDCVARADYLAMTPLLLVACWHYCHWQITVF